MRLFAKILKKNDSAKDVQSFLSKGALRTLCESLCQSIILGNEDDFMRLVPAEDAQKRAEEFLDIIMEVPDFAVHLWCQKGQLSLTSGSTLSSELFSIDSDLMEPHSSMGLDTDDHEFDGCEVSLFLNPAVQMNGNAEGEQFGEKKTWCKATVLVFQNAEVQSSSESICPLTASHADSRELKHEAQEAAHDIGQSQEVEAVESEHDHKLSPKLNENRAGMVTTHSAADQQPQQIVTASTIVPQKRRFEGEGTSKPSPFSHLGAHSRSTSDITDTAFVYSVTDPQTLVTIKKLKRSKSQERSPKKELSVFGRVTNASSVFTSSEGHSVSRKSFLTSVIDNIGKGDTYDKRQHAQAEKRDKMRGKEIQPIHATEQSPIVPKTHVRAEHDNDDDNNLHEVIHQQRGEMNTPQSKVTSSLLKRMFLRLTSFRAANAETSPNQE